MDPNTQVWILNTVAPVSCIKGRDEIGNATGFFCHYAEGSYFITNKHVIINEEADFYPDKIRLRLHVDKGDYTKNQDYLVPLYDRNGSRLWLEHPNCDKMIDLVAIPLNYNAIAKFWTNAFPIEDALQEPFISIAEELFVIGYPLNFYDKLNNFPVVRNATVASPPNVAFEGHPYFLMDSRLHAGSSGSPVLTKPNTIRLIDGKWVMQSHSLPLLVGIYSGTVPDRDQETNDPLGLGVVWHIYLIQEIIGSWVSVTENSLQEA